MRTVQDLIFPHLEGSLMFKIDGISDIPGSSDAKDVTSVFLLVSMDETAPVLTLSAPVFYADSDTGDYEITGTSDAGSEILYGDNKESVHVGSDGTFTISGNLRITVVFLPFSHRTERVTDLHRSLH